MINFATDQTDQTDDELTGAFRFVSVADRKSNHVTPAPALVISSSTTQSDVNLID